MRKGRPWLGTAFSGLGSHRNREQITQLRWHYLPPSFRRDHVLIRRRLATVYWPLAAETFPQAVDGTAMTGRRTLAHLKWALPVVAVFDLADIRGLIRSVSLIE
jgi:hypothetical protein